jgi:pimeloyl-ACP methyl ester carboxylesterase
MRTCKSGSARQSGVRKRGPDGESKGVFCVSYFSLRCGEQLYYQIIGTGSKTVVMMHGWTSNHEIFQKSAALLGQDVRCILYDHRGHGGSKAANLHHVTMDTLASDLHELLIGLDLHEVTLLGWSMGAGVAMTYVGRYGCERLKQIVLCDMTPRQLNDAQWKLGLYKGAYTRADMKRDANREFFALYEQFALSAAPTLVGIPKGVLQMILSRKLRSCDQTVLKSLSASMKAQDNRENVAKITVPLTYFYAVPGTLFSPELADWYREHTGGPYKSVAFPGSTHLLVMDAPLSFAANVKRLL